METNCKRKKKKENNDSYDDDLWDGNYGERPSLPRNVCKQLTYMTQKQNIDSQKGTLLKKTPNLIIKYKGIVANDTLESWKDFKKSFMDLCIICNINYYEIVGRFKNKNQKEQRRILSVIERKLSELLLVNIQQSFQNDDLEIALDLDKITRLYQFLDFIIKKYHSDKELYDITQTAKKTLNSYAIIKFEKSIQVH